MGTGRRGYRRRIKRVASIRPRNLDCHRTDKAKSLSERGQWYDWMMWIDRGPWLWEFDTMTFVRRDPLGGWVAVLHWNVGWKQRLARDVPRADGKYGTSRRIHVVAFECYTAAPGKEATVMDNGFLRSSTLVPDTPRSPNIIREWLTLEIYHLCLIILHLR